VHRPPEERCHDGDGDQRGQPATASDGAHRPLGQAFRHHHDTQHHDPGQQAVQVPQAPMILAEDRLVDLLQRARHREHPGDEEDQAGGGRDAQRGRHGSEQVVHDARRPAVQAQAQRNVIIDTLAGERAQQDDEREQRDQQARAEQHGLAGKVQSLQPLEEALRQGSIEPVPRPRHSLVSGGARWRCFPLSGRLTLSTVGLHHHAAPSGAAGHRRNRMTLVNLGSQLQSCQAHSNILGSAKPPALMRAGRAQTECSSARQFPATTAKPG
jgi:hypothetical protein